jgi:RHS repeat-associated protein
MLGAMKESGEPISDFMSFTGSMLGDDFLEVLVGRVTEQGQLDTAAGVRLSPFNTTGYRLLPSLTGDAVGQSVAVQPDGKILIAGRNFTTSTVATAIRLNADGSADNAFGTNGWLNTDLATGTFDFWMGLTLSWDGKMYLSGTASGDFAAGRYNTFDGAYDGSSTHMDQRLWFQQDVNFNVTSVTNDDSSALTGGVAVERYVYTPYGQRTVLDGQFNQIPDNISVLGINQGHQGLTHDAETGLVQNRHRYLHVTLGRFTSMDPHPDGPYVDGMNGFNYVRGGPVRFVDPRGLFLETAVSTTATAATGASAAAVAAGATVAGVGAGLGAAIYYSGVGDVIGTTSLGNSLGNLLYTPPTHYPPLPLRPQPPTLPITRQPPAQPPIQPPTLPVQPRVDPDPRRLPDPRPPTDPQRPPIDFGKGSCMCFNQKRPDSFDGYHYGSCTSSYECDCKCKGKGYKWGECWR